MSTTELAWVKSSYSGSDGDACIEVALSPEDSEGASRVYVRDSKKNQGPRLALSPAAWSSFVSYTAQT